MQTSNETAKSIHETLLQAADPEHAAASTRFFKTGPGEYGEGDIFLGIRVPTLRKLAKQNCALHEDDVCQLLSSTYHEERLLALLIWVEQYRRSPKERQKRIYTLYLRSTQHINNWDLVDTSAEHIVGAYLMPRSHRPLYKLAQSSSLWERRISIMATFHFIRNHAFSDTLKIAEILLGDAHDLIHKATGWMLREVGNRSRETEEQFLNEYKADMPRTMLRYAIEKFPEDLRQHYLRGEPTKTIQH